VVALLAVAAPATAQSGEPFRPWDGRLPFHCHIQDVGTGTDFPRPHADPFCVEFDKTSQNVTNFGLVDFLAKEPARVAAASPKCFYFQRDHWTGSVMQGQHPTLWHWDGNYFFDKAKGIGGVSVYDFRIGGVQTDVRQFAPQSMKPYFHRGGGGVLLVRATARVPACAARADTHEEQYRIYREWYRLATR
jgi:hypothetical protein